MRSGQPILDRFAVSIRNRIAFAAFGRPRERVVSLMLLRRVAVKKSLMILAATLSFGSAAAFAQDATPPAAPAAPTDATAPMAPAAPAAADPGMSSPAPAASAPSAMQAATPTPPDTSSYPTCSRTVTDKCVQKAGSGGHAKKWKKKK